MPEKESPIINLPHGNWMDDESVYISLPLLTLHIPVEHFEELADSIADTLLMFKSVMNNEVGNS
ncbi:hypothetical protein LCGC14_1868720 [marine sediment metagenome]|uniref:Uncharacterized protein n=1 Tax=marine sediment metagenome TaxID=412755 RepID=A0A0F9G5J6_9ZZZZ